MSQCHHHLGKHDIYVDKIRNIKPMDSKMIN